MKERYFRKEILMFFKSSKRKSQKKLDDLCSDVDIFIQVHYVRERNNDYHKSAKFAITDTPARRQLYDFLKENGNPTRFEELCLLFFKRTEKDDCYICDKAGIERGYFARVQEAAVYVPSKSEIIRLCLAMQLNIEETKLLLSSADYFLSNSSKIDLIIRYFFEKGNYDLSDLNYVLQKFCETTMEQVVSE